LFAQLSNVGFGSLAELNDTPKAAIRAAGVARKAVPRMAAP